MNRSFRGALALACALMLPAIASAATLTATDANSAWTQTDALQKGDTLVLKGGNYGAFVLYNKLKDGVTITVAPGETVTASTFSLDGSTGITVDPKIGGGSLIVAMAPTTQYGVELQGTQNVTVTHVAIHADPTTFGGQAVWVRSAKATSVVANDISWTGGGITALDSDGITVCNNSIHDINVDAIDMAGTSNSVVCGNKVVSSHPNLAQGDHPDCIQVFNGSNPTFNLKILGNWCERGSGGLMQGVFVEDGDQVDVEGNVFLGPMANGVGFARTTNATAKGNFLQAYTLPDDAGTRIIVRQEADRVTIANNVTPAVFIGVTGEAQPTNVTVDGSLVSVPYSDRSKGVAASAPGDYSAVLAWNGGVMPAAYTGSAPAPLPTPTPAPLRLRRRSRR
jgi:nitrous oxidase accessory protein NosD